MAIVARAKGGWESSPRASLGKMAFGGADRVRWRGAEWMRCFLDVRETAWMLGFGVEDAERCRKILTGVGGVGQSWRPLLGGVRTALVGAPLIASRSEKKFRNAIDGSCETATVSLPQETAGPSQKMGSDGSASETSLVPKWWKRRGQTGVGFLLAGRCLLGERWQQRAGDGESKRKKFRNAIDGESEAATVSLPQETAGSH